MRITRARGDCPLDLDQQNTECDTRGTAVPRIGNFQNEQTRSLFVLDLDQTRAQRLAENC